MRITIVGAGYVGLVSAACLARMGHVVALLEIQPDRVEQLSQGRAPFHEPGLDELVQSVVEGGMLSPTSDPGVAFPGAELVMVCVGTPLGADGEADLSQVRAACAAIAKSGTQATVVMRSTMPLGSTAWLAGWLGRHGNDRIVTNPEFLRQGSAIADFVSPTRVVIGTDRGMTTPAASLIRDLYAKVGAPVLITDYASAEMIKNAANAFLAMRLSFVNEVADLCEAYGADIEDVVTGIGLDPRIGSSYMRPGIGFGGSCLPKELANLVRLGRRRGLAMPLLEGVGRVNDGRATRIVDRLEGLLGSLNGKRVALLGLAFKPNTDDTRYSPAMALADRLAERGAAISAHDPVVPDYATDRMPSVTRASTAEEAVSGADLVILATEWDDYRNLPWSDLAGTATSPVIFDGRNILDHRALTRAGWQVIAVGRSPALSDDRVDEFAQPRGALIP